MKDWLPDDDLAHFVIAAAERAAMSAFQVNDRNSGRPQYHPRMMLALLVYAYANGLFSSRRIERATHRDLGMRFVTANTHPDHDTIAAFRRQNRPAFEAAFLDILLMARRGTFKAKLDAACDRMEAQARADAEAARPAYEAKKAAYDIKTGQCGRPPKPPNDDPPPERQSNLTDPDSALMRRSAANEYLQAYNAQAVVCADGAQLILATNLGMHGTIGLPGRVLADTGYASGPAIAALQARGIEPLVAIGRTQPSLGSLAGSLGYRLSVRVESETT